MRKTLFSYEKGKTMHASGSVEPTSFEKTVLYLLFGMFFVLVFAAIVAFGTLHFVWGIVLIVLAIADFASIFIFGFGIFKDRGEKLNVEYYEVDRKSNAITGEHYDNTKQISKEEFFGKEKQ